MQKAKQFLVGCLGLLFICGAIYVFTDCSGPSTPTTRAPTPATLEGRLQRAAEDNLPAIDGTTVQCDYSASSLLGGTLTLTYDLGDLMTIEGALLWCTNSFMATAPLVFEEDPTLNVLNAFYMAKTQDKYGREGSRLALLKIQLLRETADKMVWENIYRCDLPGIMEFFAVHRNHQADWLKLCD